MKRFKTIQILLIVGLAILLALIVRWLFSRPGGDNLFAIMTIGFIFLLPMGVGALTIFLSNTERVEKFSYRFFMPWWPIFGFFILTLAFSIEGWACWLMVLPVFLLSASIGGLIAGYFKLKKKRSEKLSLSVMLFLPFLVSPIEQSIKKIPGQYQAYTSIDIKAPKEKIWSKVTRVTTISAEEDRGWLTRNLGFPRPIRAELNYEGVGAFRKAVFDKGLVFNETVLEYIPQTKMTFSIKANPYEIPSTTMDEHIVIGGKYFDVLNGTYELEALDNGSYRLHLYSRFKLSTTFNFYASWWAGWIMKDIQQNILQVIKARAEQ